MRGMADNGNLKSQSSNLQKIKLEKFGNGKFYKICKYFTNLKKNVKGNRALNIPTGEKNLIFLFFKFFEKIFFLILLFLISFFY